ncbi:MAG: VTT domain-containing protein [Gammaproteobacteria bacterium]|nr:VTT domain-containing protein [Gammaproteobacteria bacterium]
MDDFSLTNLLIWLEQSPQLTLLVVFLAAFSESLAIVGLFVPGAAIMVSCGALVAMGVLPVWPTLLVAVIGAILGDSLSYWVGYRYKHTLRLHWPFSRYPDMLDRGIRFFEKHGGKSVALGRFVGPIRAVVPLIAGMLEMPRQRFLLTNIASAIVWAPVYMFPGYLFGLSLEVASEFAGRFLILLAILIVTVWFVIFVIQQIYLWFVPYIDYLFWRLLVWVGRHPVLRKISSSLVSTSRPEIRGLSVLAIILVIAAANFTFVYQLTIHLDFIDNLNQFFYQGLYQLHNPVFDRLMLGMISLNHPQAISVCAIITTMWLLWQRNWLALWHLLAAVLLPLALFSTTQFIGNISLTQVIESHIQLNYTPSLILAFSVYGFIAIILARELQKKIRLFIYATMAILILLISFAHLYFGLDMMTQVIADLSLALVWLALLGIGYRRHISPLVHGHHTLLLFTTLFLFIGFYPVLNSEQPIIDNTPSSRHSVMSRSAWLDSGWEIIDSFRNDIRKQHLLPFNIQWRGKQNAIQNVLTTQQWQQKENQLQDYFSWLNEKTAIEALPLLPHVHNGRHEDLRMIKIEKEANRIAILRLWRTRYQIKAESDQQALWVGNITYLSPVQHMGLRFLKTQTQIPSPQTYLQQAPSLQYRKRAETSDSWDGNVVLLETTN